MANCLKPNSSGRSGAPRDHKKAVGALIAVAALSIVGCGSSGEDTGSRETALTGQANKLSSAANEAHQLEAEIAGLPRRFVKPAAAKARATRLANRARKLEASSRSLTFEAAALEGSREDLVAADRKLANAASQIKAAAGELEAGNREPNLTTAKRSLSRANELMESAFGKLDRYVASDLAGAVQVRRPQKTAVAAVRLPPLPDLAFNFNDLAESQVGDWSPSADTTIAGAESAFGPPDVTCAEQQNGSSGNNDWVELGLQVMQADFGGGDSCEGPVQVVEVRGEGSSRWVTNAGLRIGDSVRTVRRLYPDVYESDSPQSPGEVGLVLASERGNVPRDFVAVIENGKVAALRMWIGGAGE